MQSTRYQNPHIENMNKFIKNAGLIDTQIGKCITDVVSQYENCKPFEKPTSRPVVDLPKVTDFNQTISADLHYLEPSTWYHHD